MKVGAGVGSWTKNYMDFIQGYLGTSIDFIDIHIYPVNRDYLNRVLLMADAAKNAGKEVGISEIWLQKVRDSELGVLNYNVVFARDAFSFWAPLDALHLQVVTEMASQKGMAFISAFWSDYFRSYLDYSSSIANLGMGEMRALLQAPQAAATAAGAYTSTGIAYLKMIAPPDTTAPAAPVDNHVFKQSPTAAGGADAARPTSPRTARSPGCAIRCRVFSASTTTRSSPIATAVTNTSASSAGIRCCFRRITIRTRGLPRSRRRCVTCAGCSAIACST